MMQNYDVKLSAIESKYFTTSDYNKFMNNVIDAKIKKIVNNADIS